MLADLHIHSCFSDGTNTPEEIAALAAQKGIGLLSVTDHNDIRAYARTDAACRAAGIRLIRGVEADCRHRGGFCISCSMASGPKNACWRCCGNPNRSFCA
ncbi:MAG: PHP domain-containing protein [Oscillospiraceae bacterium]